MLLFGAWRGVEGHAAKYDGAVWPQAHIGAVHRNWLVALIKYPAGLLAQSTRPARIESGRQASLRGGDMREIAEFSWLLLLQMTLQIGPSVLVASIGIRCLRRANDCWAVGKLAGDGDVFRGVAYTTLGGFGALIGIYAIIKTLISYL